MSSVDGPHLIRSSFEAHLTLMMEVARRYEQEIDRIATVLIECVKRGGTIFWCGNGGSAADSQHLAAEMIGRFRRERRPFCSVALTTNTSILTAVGNDYGYDEIFSRQVAGLVRVGDVVVGLSTSGNSRNVVMAMGVAKSRSAATVGLLGRDGGALRSLCDYFIVIPSDDTARIQEAHITIGHIFCDLVEQACA